MNHRLSLSLITTYLILLLVAFVLPFVVGPILLHRSPGLKVHHNFVQVSEEAARQHFPSNSFRVISQLEQIGFQLVAHVVTGDQIVRVNVMVSLLVNRDSRTMASVTRAFTTKRIGKTLECVSFSTEFADGTEIVTTNSPAVAIFRHGPQRLQFNVPQLSDVWRLHYIHSHYVAERKDSAAALPAPGDEISHFQKSYERVLAEQMSAGFFHLDEETGRYRYTWLSAMLFAWRLLWPVKPILLSGKRYRGRLIARAAGISNL